MNATGRHILVTALMLAASSGWLGSPSAQEAAPARLTCQAIELPTPITFVPGDELLDAGGQARVAEVAALLMANPWIEKLLVRVHSDSLGNDAFNLRITRKRAEVVVAELIRLGIDPTRLEGHGLGETEPVAPNTTPAGRALNRRIELRIQASACPVPE